MLAGDDQAVNELETGEQGVEVGDGRGRDHLTETGGESPGASGGQVMNGRNGKFHGNTGA